MSKESDEQNPSGKPRKTHFRDAGCGAGKLHPAVEAARSDPGSPRPNPPCPLRGQRKKQPRVRV